MKTAFLLILLGFSMVARAQTIEYDPITKKGVVLLETRAELRERHKQERIAFRSLPRAEKRAFRQAEKAKRIYHNSPLTPGEKVLGVAIVGFIVYMAFDDVYNHFDR